MNMSRWLQTKALGFHPEVCEQAHLCWKGGGESSSEVKIPKFQQNAMKDLYSQAKNTKFDEFYGGSDGFNPVADLTPEQQAALGSIADTGSGLQGIYNTQGASALQAGLGTYDPSKTGLTGAIDASNNRLDWNYNTQVAPQVRQGAQESGQFGSTRHGVAEGIALSNMGQQKMDAANSLAFQDQQNFTNQRNQLLQNLGGITSGMTSGAGAVYDAGALQQKQNQAEIVGQLEKWAYENNVPAEELKLYMAAVQGTPMAGSSTTTSGGGPSKGQSALSGAAAGATIGSVVPGIGTAIGAGVGAIGGYFAG